MTRQARFDDDPAGQQGRSVALISRKARELSPFVLAIIPATYLLGMIGIGVAGVHGQSTFSGRYLMFVYFAVCVVTVAVFLVQRGAHRRSR